MSSSTIANLIVNINANISGFAQGMNQISGQMRNIGRDMAVTGDALTRNVTQPILGVAKTALQTAADFETGMNRVVAVSGATGEQFKKLEEQAMELGRTTQFTASQASDAMGFLAMAGFKADDILSAMPGTLQLAASAQLDLGRAADIVSNILTGYGKDVNELAHVNDVLVKAMTSANVDLSMLGESMKYAGPIASAMSLEFEEVAAAVGMMGNAGIQGSMAGTAIRGALSRLSSPTKEAAVLMQKLGMNVMGANGQIKPLVEIVRQLEAGGATASDMLQIFGDRAGPAFAALVEQGSDSLASFTQELKDSGGTAAKIAGVQMQGLNGAMKELQSAIEGLMISFAKSGMLEEVTKIVKQITTFVGGLNKLSPAMKRVVVIVALVVAAIGPLLVIIGMLASGISVVTGAIGAIAGALSGVLGPVILVIAAIAALVVGIKYLWDTNEEFRNAVIKVWQYIQSQVQAAIKGIQAFWAKYGDQIVGAIQKAFNFIWTIVSNVLQQIGNSLAVFLTYVQPIWESVKKLFMSLWEVIVQLYKLLEPVFIAIGAIVAVLYSVWAGTINGIIQALGPFIQAVIDAANFIINILGFVIALLRGDWSAAWDFLVKAGEAALSMLGNIFMTIYNFVKGFVEGVIGWFKGLWEALVGHSIVPDIVNGVLSWFTNMTNGAAGLAGKLVGMVLGHFNNMAGNIGKIVGSAWNWGKNMVGNMVDGINSMKNKVGDAVAGIAGKIKGFLGFSSPTEEGPGSTADRWAPNFVKMFNSGLVKGIPKIQSAFGEMFAPVQTVQTAPALPYSSRYTDSEPEDNKIELSGKITIVGVDNEGQFIAVADYVAEELSSNQDRFAKVPSPRRIFKG